MGNEVSLPKMGSIITFNLPSTPPNTTSPLLPPTCRALICHSPGQLSVETIATPDALPGSVVVKVLAALVDPISVQAFAGDVPLAGFPTPFIPGARCVGRVVSTGPDTTSLELGQLVMLDPYIKGRDATDVRIIWGLSSMRSPQSQKLMADSWRHGMFAEYVRAPLENCHALNEKLLLGSPAEGGFGYSMPDLVYISKALVPYGGLRSIDLKVGETVIVAPATGGFSGAAVEVASAIGARVIAIGRNMEKLKKVAEHNLRVVPYQLKGNHEEDTAALKQLGRVDAYIDMSPATAADSTHLRSCFWALKPDGRASLMGSTLLARDLTLAYRSIMLHNFTIKGRFMCDRDDAKGVIRLAETGFLKLGKSAGHEVVGQFPLEDWQKAFETAKNNPDWGKSVLLTP